MASHRRITSRRNPRIKEIRALAARRRHRHDAGLSIVEGPRWLAALAASQQPLRQVLVADDLAGDEGTNSLLARLPAGVEILQVTPAVMAAASPSKSPQGLLAVISLASMDLAALPPGTWLVANGLQDPGNLGAVMRSAAAFEAAAVICTAGTVDWMHPVVLRAATPAVLRLAVAAEIAEQALLSALEKRGGELVVAQARRGLPPHQVDWQGTRALVMGHEVRGVAAVLQEAAAVRVTVPMPGAVDSLNVAVAMGIILYEASRGARPQARVESESC